MSRRWKAMLAVWKKGKAGFPDEPGTFGIN
jgi:hypothetical protein